MYKLSIKQINSGRPDEYRVFLNLSSDGPAEPEEEAAVNFTFRMTEADQESLRWYLEDYLEYPFEPNPAIAARVEGWMADLGRQLFRDVFESEEARDLWAVLRRNLNQTRIEVAVEDVRQATAVPWELLRDPRTDMPLALRAASFVRSHSQPRQRAARVRVGGAEEKTRILLVICRPGGRDDVPFRSVASRLLKGLSDEAREAFQLDVLRPPTFARLSEVLRQANERGKPYHIIHFDGHGTYIEGPEDEEEIVLSRHLYKGLVSGSHGYLLFEDPIQSKNMELVDGFRLGNLMVETNTPVLVLNACRSAHAETAAGETTAAETIPSTPDATEARPARAFGSLAQEVMDTGVAGIVAMRYNVYVVTAAQFVADLYTALGRGQSLGAAVSAGRKQLHANPSRTIAYDPIDLQDWLVPIVYEAAPIGLFPEQKYGRGVKLTLDSESHAAALQSLPSPDTEFIGRDETLLALDRAFDRHSIVLLEAYAGSGKTMTAAEFARWYSLTGGLEGPVLFTSFERPQPLPLVLDQLGKLFEGVLAQNGIQWLALDENGRRDIALQLLGLIPVLWIWDNVEPVAGFPRAEDAELTAAQQRELADFMRAARGTKAKFLLTSRREERGWLGDLPRRIHIPPMPMQERTQLARALADQVTVTWQVTVTSMMKDWQPLLDYTQGNPMTINSLVGQALREGLRSKEQIEAFVEALRRGEAKIMDEETQGRSKSLAASLNYGFERAFDERERAQLALLHFFQGFVNVGVLQVMGNPDNDWSLPILHDVRRETLIDLLNRAADIGLLTPLGRNSGFYTIHPALPWFFQARFNSYYPDQSLNKDSQSAIQAAHAFVEVMGQLGEYYLRQFSYGNQDVIAILELEEANLLQAHTLARRNDWSNAVIGTMQGLRQLYTYSGRRTSWRRLVIEIVPDFVASDSESPLPEREEAWEVITHYRVHLAQEERNWAEAERLQKIRVQWNRHRTSPFLPDPLQEQYIIIRSLAGSLLTLGQIEIEQGKEECIPHIEEAFYLSEKIKDQASAATCALNLSLAYVQLSNLRDLVQAEQWCQRSLSLWAKTDPIGQAKCYNELGFIAYEQLVEAKVAEQPEITLLELLNKVIAYYHKALELLPPNAADDLVVTHTALGNIYSDLNDNSRALNHYMNAIRYCEEAGDLYRAAGTRRNVALALAQNGRLADARDFAAAALRNFEEFGPGAADLVEETRGLLARIEAAMGQGGR